MSKRRPQASEPRPVGDAALGAPPTFAGSALADAARNAVRHMAGDEYGTAPGDRAELWGRRIGRALSLLGCLALAIYLYLTYLR